MKLQNWAFKSTIRVFQRATFDNPGGINLQSRDVIIDKNNTKWIADNRYGLVSVENDKSAFYYPQRTAFT